MCVPQNCCLYIAMTKILRESSKQRNRSNLQLGSFWNSALGKTDVQECKALLEWCAVFHSGGTDALVHFYGAAWNGFVVSVSRQLNSPGCNGRQCGSEVKSAELLCTSDIAWLWILRGSALIWQPEGFITLWIYVANCSALSITLLGLIFLVILSEVLCFWFLPSDFPGCTWSDWCYWRSCCRTYLSWGTLEESGPFRTCR